MHYLNCRQVNQVQGFTPETLIALAANIKIRQWHRAFLYVHGLPPEHPRDDKLFSILRDTDFKLKLVHVI